MEKYKRGNTGDKASDSFADNTNRKIKHMLQSRMHLYLEGRKVVTWELIKACKQHLLRREHCTLTLLMKHLCLHNFTDLHLTFPYIFSHLKTELI